MVTVLLAVYNGEKYLAEQLDSILNQTEKNIKILIRDDGSTDNSLKIIDLFCERYSNIISKISGDPTGGAAQNFAELLQNCDDDYIMFCDQDDIWLPEKIEITLAAMKSAEGEDASIPVLVHGDLKVVDQDLNVISQSMLDYQRLNCENLSLPKLLVQNYVTGCTVMINRALKQKCGKIPPNCIMHDWWLAIIAQLFGKIVCINEPLLLYRQHTDNQVGAKSAHGLSYVKQKLKTLDRVRANYNATYRQSKLVLDKYSDILSDEQIEVLKVYCLMPSMSKFKRIKTMQKYGFKKGTAMRVIGQYILM